MNYKPTNSGQMSFASYDVKRRTAKNKFFSNINKIINWAPIEKELKQLCSQGKQQRGQKAYNPLILFKMQLISIWYNLSDVQTEEMANENLSAMKFCNLALEDPVPDHSTLSRFRTTLTQHSAYDKFLTMINNQLSGLNLIVKNGSAKVDASLTKSSFSPKGTRPYSIATDRQEDERSAEDKNKETTYHASNRLEQPGTDNEARWIKKGKKVIYGYKKHIATDENGLVLGVHTTPANEHDSKGLAPLVDKLPAAQRKEIMADKGYKSKDNDEMLRHKESKSRVMHKAYRNTPLTQWQKRYNQKISQTRWVVERTFGSIKRWFGGGVTRLKGKAKVHSLHVLEAMAYNLKRSPGLVYQLAK